MIGATDGAAKLVLRERWGFIFFAAFYFRGLIKRLVGI